MSGKRVPGQVWRKLGPGPGGGKGGGSGGSGVGRADERIAALMDQYRQMLRFLGEKGCLLNSVRPEVQLLQIALGVQAVLGIKTQHPPAWTSFTVPLQREKRLPEKNPLQLRKKKAPRGTSIGG